MNTHPARGTRDFLQQHGVPSALVLKIHEGRPNIADSMINDEISMVINTPFGRGARTDGYFIRTAAVEAGVPSITTTAGMFAAVQAIEALISGGAGVRSLQDYLREGAS